MAFTIYYSKKKVGEYKDKNQYREALIYLEGIIDEHSKKKGFRAWFKNESPLLDLLDELKPLRVAQCIEEAESCMKDKTDTSGTKDKPLIKSSLEFYREAKRLIEEAGRLQGASEDSQVRLLMKRAGKAIFVIETYDKAANHLEKRCLTSARECFMEVRDDHASSPNCLKEIETHLNACHNFGQKVSQDIEKRDFFSARKGLDEIFRLNREDEHYSNLLEEVQNKEKADELISGLGKKVSSGGAAGLYSALRDLKEAEELDPKHESIAELENDIKGKIAVIKYSEGLDFRDNKKDILKAIESFREIENLGVSYSDSGNILNELATVEKEIASSYDHGISCGKNLENAISVFRKAQAFGYHYRDLDEKLIKCEKELKRCNMLLSEAENLIGPDKKEYQKAIEKIQEALILYPSLQKAKALLETAQNKNQLQKHLNKAQSYLDSKDFRYGDALREIDEALKFGPDNSEAILLRQKINEKTLDWLEGRINLFSKEKKLTSAIKLIKTVSQDVPPSLVIKNELKVLEGKETEARRYYQDGFGKLNQARACDITDEEKRSVLYREAGECFRNALDSNRDLREIVAPELEALEREIEEWKAYLEALRLFEREEYEKCFELLASYKEKPLVKEISKLVLDTLNRLGFSGSFQLTIDGLTYIIIPDNEIHLGRNTATFKENKIALKLQDVSRKHGLITRSGSHYFYEDRYGCTHGTLVNGQGIERKIELKNNDILGYGFFREEDGSPANKPPAACLKLIVYPCEVNPTLKINCEPSDHEDFCEDRDKIYILIGDILTIGRGKGNTIVVKDKSIASEHISICREENRYCIKDMGTPGGSFINSDPIISKRTLQLGDRIRMGNIEMSVEDISTKQ